MQRQSLVTPHFARAVLWQPRRSPNRAPRAGPKPSPRTLLAGSRAGPGRVFVTHFLESAPKVEKRGRGVSRFGSASRRTTGFPGQASSQTPAMASEGPREPAGEVRLAALGSPKWWFCPDWVGAGLAWPGGWLGAGPGASGWAAAVPSPRACPHGPRLNKVRKDAVDGKPPLVPRLRRGCATVPAHRTAGEERSVESSLLVTFSEAEVCSTCSEYL